MALANAASLVVFFPRNRCERVQMVHLEILSFLSEWLKPAVNGVLFAKLTRNQVYVAVSPRLSQGQCLEVDSGVYSR
jgi:hypothetical protein